MFSGVFYHIHDDSDKIDIKFLKEDPDEEPLEFTTDYETLKAIVSILGRVTMQACKNEIEEAENIVEFTKKVWFMEGGADAQEGSGE